MFLVYIFAYIVSAIVFIIEFACKIVMAVPVALLAIVWAFLYPITKHIDLPSWICDVANFVCKNQFNWTKNTYKSYVK